VDGVTVEVRITDDESESEYADQQMLLPWVEFPFNAIGVVQATPGGASMPDPPEIPTDEEEA